MAQKDTGLSETYVSLPEHLIPTIGPDSPGSPRTELLPTAKMGARGTVEHDENDLLPSRRRFVAISIFLVFIAGWLVLNAFNVLSQTSGIGIVSGWTDGVQWAMWVAPELSGTAEVGDEIVTIDGRPVDARYKVRQLVRNWGPNESHAFSMKRAGVPYELTVNTYPLPAEVVGTNVLLAIVLPAAFFLVGVIVFMFKPNNRLTVLISIAFALIAASMSPLYFISFPEGSFPLVLYWQTGYFLSLFSDVVLLHFFLYFPKPSRLVRRFPTIPVLIYLPFLLYVLPTEIGQQVSWNGITSFDIFYNWKFLFLGDFFYSPYLIANLVVLFLNYRDADEMGKRRMRLLMAGIPLTVLPQVFVDLILPAIEHPMDMQLLPTGGLWRELVGSLPILFAPPIFAYAVVKHRVIPISFIVRRGLQYIFAKNGLRLLTLLPAAGIAWSVASNSEATLNEIIFHNSTTFYILAALAVGFGLLSRFRLNEWIDRRFFRQQYDQERFLHSLIENVKDSDSMATLSRSISEQIKAAMHPSSIHFFYEDVTESEFSLGFTTDERLGRMKLAAGSPLLRFMQTRDGCVDFPSTATGELPASESEWLTKIGTKLLVPMHGSGGKLAGFFSLGEKLSETAYSAKDREMLETLAKQIALVQENLNLKDRVMREQKIKHEVLSRFDEGQINLLKECPRCGKCFDRPAVKCDDDGAELTFTLPVERTIDERYRLDRLLGRGGMGAVYEAYDQRIRRTVAVKLLKSSGFGNRDALRRFEREARTAGRVHHRNIVTIFDYGLLSTEGAFLVMELVRGPTLSDILEENRRLSLETMKLWFGQILSAVETAHGEGIIHRDLKPDNILVAAAEDGGKRLCILDFGIARLDEIAAGRERTETATGTILGTFGYMSPEQLQGERADERSDLFSITIMIYEALHGTRPFQGGSYYELLASMTDTRTFGPPFADFFERGLSFEREGRFRSAAELRAALLGLTSNGSG